MTAPKISPYRRGYPRYPHDPERQMSSEVKVYYLNDEELEELNKKYPRMRRTMSPTERSASLINNMDKQRQKKLEEMRKEGRASMTNNKEPKITREELLEECKEHGMDWDAAKIIAEKYGLAKNTIKNYINKWGIKKELQPEQSEEPKEVINDEDNYSITQHGMHDEFRVIRKGKFDKEKAVKILYSVASLLDREEGGHFLIDLNVRQG